MNDLYLAGDTSGCIGSTHNYKETDLIKYFNILKSYYTPIERKLIDAIIVEQKEEM